MHVFLSIIKSWSAHFPQSDVNLNYVSFFFFSTHYQMCLYLNL